MRKPQGWFEWVKLLASVALWILMISFIAHWIYQYDACRRGAASVSPQAGCLVMSLFSTYMTWWLHAVGYFFKLVSVVL